MRRIIKTQDVKDRLGGISYESMRQLRMRYPELLQPVMRGYYSAEKVEKLIDILTGVQSQSEGPDLHKVLMERIARRGEHKGAIPH